MVLSDYSKRLYLIFQTLEEPEGDGKALDAEFGGHRVLAVMRPPTRQLSAQGPVSYPQHVDAHVD